MENSLQYVSDIILTDNNYDSIITPSAQYLAILGNIYIPDDNEKLMNLWDDLYMLSIKHKGFFDFCSSNFEYVFIIAGNKDYYTDNTNMDDVEQCIQSVCDSYSNVIFLNHGIFETNDFIFCGFTGWHMIPSNRESNIKSINADYSNIKIDNKCITVKDTNTLSYKDIMFSNGLINLTGKKIIILSNFVPTIKVLLNDNDKYMYGYGTTNIVPRDNANVVAWLHGHYTHPEFTINNCQFLSNPQLNNPNYNPELFFNI
jgi:hypothetical protein